MKLVIVNKRTMGIFISIVILGIIVLSFFKVLNKTKEIFNQDVYYQGNVDKRIIAFACNIDWGNEYIPPMLEIFKENDINITYFVTGKWAEKNKDILKDIYEHGHEIGNHGYSHVDYDKLSYEGNFEQISKAHNIIKETLMIDSKYFSPPSGAYNENTVKASKDLGYEFIMWSIDTIDWRKDSTKPVIIDRVISKAHNSAIVLMHPTAETVKALPEIIKRLYENDYKIGTIDEVILKE